MKKTQHLFRSIVKSNSKSRRNPVGGNQQPRRKMLHHPEELEMRLMPAIFSVINVNDSGAGSFRQAILDANANTTDALDTIQFNSSLAGQTITLSSIVTVADAANKNLQITGLGASSLTIAGGSGSGLIQFNTATTITDLKLGSSASNNVILPGTSALTLGNIALAGSLTVSGCATTSCISVTGPVTATGSGSVSVTGRNVYISSSIVTQTGSINVTADNGAFQSGSFTGIFMDGEKSNLTTAGGSITLKGRAGGAAAQEMRGVCISLGTVYAGGTGCITIQGVGGNSSAGFADGFKMYGGRLATVNGGINISGTSCGSGGQDYGAYFDSATLFAGGAGCMSVSGTSGTGSFAARGVMLYSSNLKTEGGCITLSGTSCGTGSLDQGFIYQNSYIEVTAGTGGISFTGISGTSPTSASDESGLYMYNNWGGNQIRTANGSITLNGQARGTASDNTGVVMHSTVLITAGGTGTINLMAQSANSTANAYSFQGGRLNTDGGNITITANSVAIDPAISKINATASGTVRFHTLGAGINLGGADSAANLGLSVSELSAITAGTLSIGRNLGSIVIPNFGFESPKLTTNGYQYTPANGNWTFNGQAGIAANGSAFKNPTALQGNQVSFVQNLGTVQQAVAGFQTDGLYALSYYNVGRPNYGDPNPIQVSVGNANLGIFTPANSTGYGLTTSSLFSPGVSNATITFAGQNSSGDHTTFIDSISIKPINASNIYISDSIKLAKVTNLQLATAGNITEIGAGNLVVSSGSVKLDAGGDILLNNATNNFSAFSGNAANVNLVNTGAIQFGGLTATGNLTVSAGGAITQTGVATITGTSSFSTPGNAITLTQNNSFQGQVTSCGSSVQIANVNSQTLTSNSPASVSVASGSTATLSINATGTSSPTVQWQKQTEGFVSSDTTTLGSWKGVYGATGSVIPNDATSLPSYATVSTAATRLSWSTSTTDTRALQKSAAGSTDRIAPVWYTTGGPFDINVAFTDGKMHAVTLYLLDWDHKSRAERIDVIDTATNTILDSRTFSGFDSGTYATWNVQDSVKFTITLTGGLNPVVSGVFIDEVNWANVQGANSTTYTLQQTTSSDDGSRYRAIVTNSVGTFTTSSAKLSLVAGTAPSITTQPVSTTANSGATATFTASASGSPAPTVQWQVSTNSGSTWTDISGANSNTYSITTAAADNGKQYKAVYTSSLGTVSTNAATLTVNYLTIASQPTGVTVNAGSTATFTASASSNPSATVQWQVSTNGGSTWTNISGATSNSYSITTAAADNGKQYKAVYTNSVGTAATNAATLTVKYLTIASQPTGVTVNAGSTATFTASASSNPSATVQWQVSTNSGSTWTNISGATSNTYSITTASADNGKQYKAVYTNSVGTVATNAATLTVNYLTIASQPTGVTVNAGSTATFTASASSNPSATVQWQVSTNSGSTWTNISGATSNSYSITTASADNGKQYKAVYTNSVGTVTTNAVSLTVNYAPSVTSNPENVTYAQGVTATFTASASGNPSPTVQWQVSTNGGSTWTNIAGATSTTYAFQQASGDVGKQFHAVFTNSVGSATTAAALLSEPVTVTTLDVGGVAFRNDSGFQVSGSTYTATGPVYLGYVPASGTSFYKLLELGGTISVNTSTLSFSATGAIKAAVISPSVTLVSGGISSGSINDLLSGKIAGLAGSIVAVAGVNFKLDKLGFNATGDGGKPVVQLQGSVSLPGGLNLAVNGTNTVNVTTSGFSLTGACASLSNNFTVGGISFEASNLTGAYTSASNTFTVTGQGSATVAGFGNVVVNFGDATAGSQGLVVKNGAITSLDAAASVNTSLAGASFTADKLRLKYNGSLNQYTISGNAGLAFGSSNNLTMALGNDTAPGVVIANGSLTSLNATATVATGFAGASFTASALSLSYVSTPSQKFSLYGDANLNFGAGRNLNLTLGNAGVPGMVITNGSLTSLNATANTVMTLGGASFTANGLTMTYVSSPSKFTVYGNASLGFNSNKTIPLLLGNAGSPGLVVSSGSLTALNATSSFSGLSIGGVSLSATNLNVVYAAASSPSPEQFALTGNASVVATGLGTVSMALGSPVTSTSPGSKGIVISGGSVSSFDMTVNSNLTIAGVTLGVAGLRMTENVTTGVFTMTGNTTLTQPKLGTVSVILGCATATPATTGLVVTNGSLSSLDMTVNSNITVAGTTFRTTGLRITENTTTNVFTMTGNSSLTVPNLGTVNVGFGCGSTAGLVITNGALTSLSATITGSLSIGGVSFSTSELTFTENTSTEVFTLAGGSSFSAAGLGNLNVYFGGAGSSGLVVKNGQMQSLNMTVTSDLAFAGVSFSTKNMTITGDTANNTYTVTGRTSASVTGIGNIDVLFGKTSGSTILSRGLVIKNGSLTSLDMTVDSNIQVAGLTFATQNLNLLYSASTSTTPAKFAMTGLTSATIASIGSISVGFGCSTIGGTSTSGLVISGGSLKSLDMSVTSDLTVGGLNFKTENLTFLYNSSQNFFAMTGVASVTVPSVGSISVGFGSGTSYGLVVKNGSLTSLDMTVNSDLNIGSLSIKTKDLNFTYVASSHNFTMRGTASVSMPSVGDLEVTFGNATRDGLVINNGSFKSLDMTVNSSFSAGSMSFTTKDLNIYYVAADKTFAMTGTAGMAMPSIGNIDVTFGKTASDGTIINRGLVITNGAFKSLDVTVNSDFRVGGNQFHTKDLNFAYYTANSTFTMRGTAGAVLPSIGTVDVTFGNATTNGLVFVGGAFRSFDFTLNSNIRVGSVFITTKDLNFAYTESTKTFTMRGTAGAAMPSIGNVDVTLGNATTNGLVIRNGSLVSLDMTLNSNFTAGGIAFSTRNLNFTYVTSTAEFTMSGTAMVSMPSLGFVEVTLGKVDLDGTVRSRGLIVKEGQFVSLDMTVNGNIRIGTVTGYTRNLNFTYVESTKVFTMSGSVGVLMPVGVIEVTLGKVDLDGTVRSRGLIVENGNFVSLDMTVNSMFYVGSCAIYTKNLNFTYVTDTQTFTMSGTAGVVLPSGYVDVTLGQYAADGTKLSSGLIVQNGQFVSLDMTLNSSLTVNNITFATKNLNFTYVESTKTFTLTGTASVSMPVLATVEVVFGGGDTKGLVITDGRLTSLDMTVNASVLGVGDFSLGSAKMKFTYSASTSMFTMSGTAKIGFPGIGETQVTLGGDGTTGMVIDTSTNKLMSFDMSVDSDFTVAGLTFGRSHLKISYADEEKKFTMSGTATVNLYIKSFTASLGSTFTKADGTQGRSDGLVFRNGQLESLDFTVSEAVELAGLSMGSATLYVSYDGPNKTFDMVGTADMTLSAKLPSWAKTFMGLSGSGAVHLGSAKVSVHIEPGFSSQGDNSVTTANLPTGGFDFESPDESRYGYFDGLGQHYQIPSTSLENFTNGFSAGMWVYPTEVKSWGRFFDFGKGKDSDNILFTREGNSNSLFFSVRRGSSEQFLRATNALTLNTWQYIAVSQDSSGNTIIYKDGVALASGYVHTPNNTSRSNSYIAKSNWGDPYYAGHINAFNIWNRALSGSEISAAQNTTFGGNENGLVVSYTLTGYHYNPVTSTWAFSTGSGITSNVGGFTNGIQPAPQGTQAAFLQNQGYMTTTAVTMTPGKKYAITFATAERSTDTVKNPVEVLMDGQLLGTFTPLGSSYVSYTTTPFTAGSGSHTLTFRGTVASGDSTAFVDNISVNELLEQPTLTAAPVNPTPFTNAVSLVGGSTGKIQLPSVGFNDFTNGLSAGVWVYPTDISSWKALFELGNYGTDRINLCQSGDVIGLEVWKGSGVSYVYSGGGVIELNKWQYFSVVQKPDGSTTLYKNGNVVATGTTSIANNINRTTNYISGNVFSSGFTGRMNSMSLFNRALSDTEVQNAPNTVYTGTETGLVGYWPLNDLAGGQVEDMGPNRYSGTAGTGVSSVAITSNFSMPYADALSFDGTNTFVKLPATGFSNFTNGFSAGIWIYPTAGSEWQRFFDFAVGADNNNIGLCRGAGNDLRFYTYNGSAGSAVSATNAIELNKWQYFSVSMQSNGTAKIYKNGTEIASGSVYVPPNVNRTNNFISKSNWGWTAPFTGKMSSLSVWNRSLSGSEMAAAPSTAYSGAESGLVGYWPMNEAAGGTVVDRATGSINDRSRNALNGTVTSSVYPQATGMNALTFDGSANSYVSLPSSGLSNFTTGFSAGVWVYPTSNAGWQRFLDIGNGAESNNILLTRNGATNDLGFYTFNGASGSSVVAPNAIELNKWQYFSVSMQSNGAAKIYKNGKEIASGSVYVPQNVNRLNNYVGKSNWGNPLYAGKMSDLSIWNRPLAQTEISSAMSTLFTGSESGLVGYWPMKDLSGSTVAEVSPSHRNGTAQSGVTSAIAPSGRATVPFNSALRFDGSTGYATLPATGFSDFTKGFSAGVWINPSSATDWQRLFDFGVGPDNNNIGICRGIGNELRFYTYNGSAGSVVVASNAIELNKWQYFSVSMQPNGTAKIYKNGAEIASGSVLVPQNVNRTNNFISKSNWGTSLYAGQMAGLSVWNRPLSAGEVAKAQTTSFSGTESGLVGYWPMTDTDKGLDGIVNGGITSVPTYALADINADFETTGGWTFTETTAGLGSGYIPNGSVWGNPIAPSGVNAVVLRGAMSQTISGFKPGVPYTFSFYAAQRPALGGQTVQIKLDNTVIGTIFPDTTDYKHYTFADIIPGAGTHTLSFTSLTAGDRSIFMDAISFTAGDAIGTNLNFEGTGGWTFAETTAGLGSGYATNGDVWGNPNAISGSQAAVLRGSMSQTLTGFNAGTSYTLSFYAALRAGYGSQTLQLMMDNTVIDTITPDTTWYKLYKFPGVMPGAGSHTLKLVSLISGDHAVFIDDIRLNSVDPKPIKSAIIYAAPQFANNSFESYVPGDFQYIPSGAIWTFTNGAGISKNGKAFLAGGDNAPDGGQAGFLQTTGSISQTIFGFATGQLYDLSFRIRNRHGLNANPMSLIVSMDGVPLGTYLNASGDKWQTFTITELNPEPGRHTFTFSTNYNSSMGDTTVLIDQIVFANSGSLVVKDQPNISRGPKNSYAAFTVDVGGVDVGLQVFFDGSVNIISGDLFAGAFNRFIQDFASAYKATASAFSSTYKSVSNDTSKAYNMTADAIESGANTLASAAGNAASQAVGGLKKAGKKAKKFFNFYVDGSTVFYDPSGIGTYDGSSPIAVTGADGSFDMVLPESPTGQLVGYGGVITATAQPNDATFTAVATAGVLSPLTTLVNNHVRTQGLSAAVAVAKIDAGLGLPTTYDLNAAGTMDNALQGDVDSALAYAAEVKVYIVAHEIAALLHGVDSTKSINSLMTTAFASISNYMAAHDGSLVDMTDQATLDYLIRDTATTSNLTINSNLSTGAATVIARVESSIDGLAASNLTEPGTLEFLQNVAAYQRLADGSVAGQLTSAGNGSISIDAVVANVTSSNLTIWANSTTIGNLRPPVLTLITDANLPLPHTTAGVGQTNYIDFPVTVSGTASSLLPISVYYETTDGTAMSSRGDYTPACGTLTWAPGDTSTKTIRVNVGTGSVVDIAKQFNLTLSNPTNSVLEYSVIVGTIDYSVFDTTTTLQTSSEIATAFAPVTFTATATYQDSASSPAAGTISFYDGTTLLGNVTTNGLGVATYTTSSLTAGNHTISARYSGYSMIGAVYNPSASSNLTQTIVKANQTISLDAIATKTYGDSPITISGNTTFSLPLTYSYLSGPVSLTDGILTITGTGHVTVQASQAGNDWVNAAPNVNLEFDVSPATLAVTIDSQSIQYGNGSLPTLTYATTGFVNGENITLATSPVTISTVAATSHAGNYNITGSGLVVPNYNVQYINGTLSITQAPLSVVVDDKTMTYGNLFPSLTYSISGFVNGDTEDDLTTPPSLSTVPATSNVGVYGITANGVTSGDYNVTYTGGCLTISQAPLTITAVNKTMTYGGNLPTLTAAYTGLVNGDTVANFTAAPALRTVSATSGAGDYAITVGDAVNDNYNITYVNGTLSINRANLTITADDKSIIVGRTLPTLTASYSGFVNGDTSDRLTALPVLSTDADAGTIGVYGISATGANSPNYNIAYVNGTLSVTKQTTATAITSSVASPVLGQVIEFTASVTTSDTNLAVTTGQIQFRIDNSSPLSNITLNANGTASFSTACMSEGHHTLTALYTGDDNNNGSTQTFSFDVAAYATQSQFTSTFDSFKVGYAATFSVTVSALVESAPVPTGTVQFMVDGAAFGSPVTIDSSGIATSGSMASLAEGTHTIAAAYVSDTGLYQSSSASTSTVVIAALTQTVTFDALPSATYGDSAIALVASASTSYPVTFAVISGPGTISGSNLTITGAGSIVVEARQAGNYLYSAATAQQTLVVNKANQTISFGPLANVSYGVSPISLTGTSTSGLTVQYTVISGPGSVVGNTLTVTGTGTILVQAAQPGNDNYNAASAVQASLTVLQVQATTALTSSLSSAIYGQSVIFTATVTSPGVVPTGTVQFFVDGQAFGTAKTLVAGQATSDDAFRIGAGNHTITANYSGTADLLGGPATNNVTQTVARAALAITASQITYRRGDLLFGVTGNMTGAVTGDSITAGFSTTATANSPLGTYPITASVNDPSSRLANYDLTLTNSTINVYETLSTTVSTATDSSNPTDDLVSLREAIDYASQLSGNQSISFAGSLYTANAATLTLTQGFITVNDNSGTVSIEGPAVSTSNRLTISGNGTSGIFNLLTPTSLSNLTLTGGNATQGGAIYNNAPATLYGVTIQQNNATFGGGVFNDAGGNLSIINATFANNTASTSGGAIENAIGSTIVTSTTIAFNSAPTGGGVNRSAGSVSLINTIVANNTAATGPDVRGTVSANHSLVANATDAVLSGSGIRANTSALLGALGFYGGTTKVYPLLPGSPAIDSGSGTGSTTDQRSVTVAGTADMGSFQSQGFVITRGTGDDQVSMIGDAFLTNLSLSIASAYGEPVDGGVITFTAPTGANSPSATLAGSTTIAGGNVSVQATANSKYGSVANQVYHIEANATGAAAAADYMLLNVGTPDTVRITSGGVQSSDLNSSFGTNLGINVKDSVGNDIPRQNVTFTPVTATGLGGIFGATGNINGAGMGAVYAGTTNSTGNVTDLTYASNAVGGLVTVVANATVAGIEGVRDSVSKTANFYLGSVGLNVQNGLIGRSFVNNVTGLMGNTTLAANLVSSGNVRIKYLGLNGTEHANTTGTVNYMSANGTSNVTINYGSLGIGGDNNTQQGDGIYQLEVDYTGGNFANANQVTSVKFHRLFGDVNGDMVVDASDYTAISNRSVYGRFGIYSQDTNGAGRVFSKDLVNVLRQRGRRVTNYNPYG